ncbi:MAG: response regulator transcription factor [Planctomycetota bacterium]|nr:response regulator transcription factor [Planctomycetota bacterium]
MGPLLLVEDDADIREDLAELLTDEGYEVETAPDGRAALAALRRRAGWGLVLLDLMMPVMDGWAFRRAQLGDPALAAIPVVVISGAADLAGTARALGVAEAVQKPFELDALLAAIRRHAAPG